MPKYAQLVIGPAGSGKSTYCRAIHKHCTTTKRTAHLVNLDPACEDVQDQEFAYAVDIRELIGLQDVMEELEYGPNGGLVYCMEYLVENLNWLADQLGDFNDDYLIIDCPGQVELYSHLPVMQRITQSLVQWGYKVCVVYLIDSLMIHDSTRFFSGVLMCLSAMIQLEMPHINVMSKCDLVATDEKERNALMQKFFDPNVQDLMHDMNGRTSGKYRALNEAMSTLISDYSMVSFLPLDITDEDSVGLVLQHVDHAIQWGEEEEPKDPDELDNENEQVSEQLAAMGIAPDM